MTDYREKVSTDRCYFCPKRTDIEVHHIVPQRFNGSDRRENLVAVCDRCHEKLERLYDSRFYDALGIADEKGHRKPHFACENCRDEQAVAKLFNNRHGTAYWFCLNCATARFPLDRLEIAEDLTGEATYRHEWCQYGERYQFKSVRPES